ncbi:uncharacterized protein IL334_004293 [Kwoniella shivajii]|uniref:Zn(2)-C6 fungal-type domain-containing protein n=1 Tax=Kwoniella shivajii TaxID=564305 RepID=A0ABZ1D014_9TREE|nr:hypothetical protein IL334_004293 [Kwoniella shivajii]
MQPPPRPSSTVPMGSMPGLNQRKQNIACDGCRSKKIRCLRTSKDQICEQCKSRSVECTNNYIDSLVLQTKSKSKKSRKSFTEENQDKDGTASITDTAGSRKRKRRKSIEREQSLDHENEHENEIENENQVVDIPHTVRRTSSGNTEVSNYDPGETSKQGNLNTYQEQSYDSLNSSCQTARHIQKLSNTIASNPTTTTLRDDTPSGAQQNLLRYLFSPYDVSHKHFKYDDISSIQLCKEGQADLWEEQQGAIWMEEPSEAHKDIDIDKMHDLADDLIDTFFSIVRPRIPLVNQRLFRERYTSPHDHPSGHIPHPLLAIVLAWGAKFSEHPTISADREECSSRDGDSFRGRQRSRLVSLIIIRTREIAERNKITRIPNMENTLSCFLLENLLGRYQAIYLSAAVKHLITLGFNCSKNLSEMEDDYKRKDAVNLWFTIFRSDGITSAFHRLKSCLINDDHDLEPDTGAKWSMGSEWCIPQRGESSLLTDRVTFFTIHQSFTEICHRISQSLWTPKAFSLGVSLRSLREFIHSSSVWRDAHLSSIGIPATWPENWDFQQAITACSIDCYYHNLWLIVYKAIKDFDIQEEKSSTGGSLVEIDSIKRRIEEESEHAALRIAALTGVLTENGYLKLDPLIINHPIYSAGLYLANLGRSEYLICVAGLRQYSIIFPSLWDQADHLERLYKNAASHVIRGSVRNNNLSTSLAMDHAIVHNHDSGSEQLEDWAQALFNPNLRTAPLLSGAKSTNSSNAVTESDGHMINGNTENLFDDCFPHNNPAPVTASTTDPGPGRDPVQLMGGGLFLGAGKTATPYDGHFCI